MTYTLNKIWKNNFYNFILHWTRKETCRLFVVFTTRRVAVHSSRNKSFLESLLYGQKVLQKFSTYFAFTFFCFVPSFALHLFYFFHTYYFHFLTFTLAKIWKNNFYHFSLWNKNGIVVVFFSYLQRRRAELLYKFISILDL